MLETFLLRYPEGKLVSVSSVRFDEYLLAYRNAHEDQMVVSYTQNYVDLYVNIDCGVVIGLVIRSH